MQVASSYRRRILSGYSRLIRWFRKFGPVLSATATSQVVSAVSLILLPVILSRTVSDIYSIGVQVGTAGLTGLVLGVVYNLVVGRPAFQHWVQAAILVSVGTPVLAAGTIAYLVFLGTVVWSGDSAGALLILALFGLGGAFLSFGATFAVRAALLGRPRGLVMVTALPNLALIAGLIVCWLAPTVSFLLPAASWAATSAVQSLFAFRAHRRAVRTSLNAAPDGVQSNMRRHLGALLAGALIATVFPSLYLASMTTLEPGIATAVFLVGRLGTAAIGLLVNSVLIVQYSWDAERRSPTRLLRWMLWVSVIAGLSGFTLSSSASLLSYLLIVSMLFSLLVASSISLREMNAQLAVNAVAVKVSIDFAVSSALLMVFVFQPSVSGYFGLFAASQAVTCLVAAVHAGKRSLAALAALALVSPALAVAVGW